MRYFLFFIIFCCAQSTLFADNLNPCERWPKWLRPVCLRPYQTWTQGDNELYLSGYAWHNRHYYDSDRLPRYNELAYGGGIGKSFYDEKGNWHGLAAIAFLDSHKNVEPAAGYVYLKEFHFNENARIGVGYALLATVRPDVFRGIPVVGPLPWMSITYRRFSITGTYIPGSRNIGNVVYALIKWVL